MGRPKGEPKERRWIPVRLLAEVDAILGREPAAVVRDVTVTVDMPAKRQTMLECIQEKVASIGQDRPRTQPVAKLGPFEARALKRKEIAQRTTNKFGDDEYVEVTE